MDIKDAHWNGLPCVATYVRVIVGKSPRSTWWCAKLEGEEYDAIRIVQEGTEIPFYIVNNAKSELKLTEGMGSPRYPHSSLPVEREID